MCQFTRLGVTARTNHFAGKLKDKEITLHERTPVNRIVILVRVVFVLPRKTNGRHAENRGMSKAERCLSPQAHEGARPGTQIKRDLRSRRSNDEMTWKHNRERSK